MRYYQQVARTSWIVFSLVALTLLLIGIVHPPTLPSFHLHRQYPLFVWARSPVSVR